ncbi:MAG TPA: proteasome subunit beta [Actinomycetota bacterium]|nr:proteasome subunit beta [Actinomycetota bacterium]
MSELPIDWTKAAFSSDANPSFNDFVQRTAPVLLPQVTPGAGGMPEQPHGTTILALTYADGVIIAGDRRATSGYSIADRKIEKVFPADDYSAVAIAGAAGPAIDMVKLFRTELEHYEKVEGERLSLEGKANKLASMIKMNLPFAMQGFLVVPLFAGYDERRQAGRIFRYDGIGGRYEESDYHADGSGGMHARGSLKGRWRRGLNREDAVLTAVEALFDAAEEDVATGGPDLIRNIYPVVATVTAEGYRRVDDDEVGRAVDGAIADRREREERNR